MYVPTLGEFISWLEQKARGEVVGKAREACSCPIATYLAENGPKGVYRVDSQYITHPNGANFKAPGWVKKFVPAVDNRLPKNVTREDALEIVLGV